MIWSGIWCVMQRAMRCHAMSSHVMWYVMWWDMRCDIFCYIMPCHVMSCGVRMCINTYIDNIFCWYAYTHFMTLNIMLTFYRMKFCQRHYLLSKLFFAVAMTSWCLSDKIYIHQVRQVHWNLKSSLKTHLLNDAYSGCNLMFYYIYCAVCVTY